MAVAGVTEKVFLDVASYIAVISDMVIEDQCYNISPDLIRGLRETVDKHINLVNTETKEVITKYIESFIKLIESGIENIKEIMDEAILNHDKALYEMGTYFSSLAK